MKQFLIRADDFGYCKGVNLATLDGVKKGVIKNVGCIVTMEDCDYLLDELKRYPIDLGLHLNITVGKPCSKKLQTQKLVDQNGTFYTSSFYRNHKIDCEDQDFQNDLLFEVQAQYERFLKLVGKKPDYMEFHAVGDPALDQLVESFCKNENILYLPFPKDGKLFFQEFEMDVILESMKKDYDPYTSLCMAIDQVVQQDAHHVLVVVLHPSKIDPNLSLSSSLVEARYLEDQMLENRDILGLLDQAGLKVLRYSEVFNHH